MYSAFEEAPPCCCDECTAKKPPEVFQDWRHMFMLHYSTYSDGSIVSSLGNGDTCGFPYRISVVITTKSISVYVYVFQWTWLQDLFLWRAK